MILSSIALSSAYFGYDYYARYESAYDAQMTAEATLSEEQASLDKLKKHLRPETGELKALPRLETFMDGAWESASRHDIRIKMTLLNVSVAASGKSTGGLASYLENIPKSRLKTAQVEISGQYATYADFQGLLADLAAAGGFISKINVRGTTFKLAYRVYGQ